ncbi:MAG: hypothetical protein ACR2K3_11250 [Nocardioides sp.]
MSAQQYLVNGVIEGRLVSQRNQAHLRAAKAARKDARRARRTTKA